MKRVFTVLVLIASLIVSLLAWSKKDDYNPRLVTETIKEFINTNYPGARIVDAEYDDGLLKIEIFHQWKEKNVYFSKQEQWQYTEWDVRSLDLPKAVKDAIKKSEFSRFRIDDVDYIQKSSGDYYRIELERGDYDVKLSITPDGKIF